MKWKPINLEELSIEISKGENKMDEKLLNFWNKIKMTPIKWKENQFWNEENSFWVVAKHKNLVLYYNDIEEGFNISIFEKEGEIKEYCVEQDELHFSIIKLLKF